MLYEFKSRATGTVVMTGPVAEQVLAFCRADSVTGQTLVLDGGHVFH